MKLALVSLAAVLAAPIAVAQGNLELSGGYSQFDEDGAELGALTGRGTTSRAAPSSNSPTSTTRWI